MISSREPTYRSVLREVSNWPSKAQLQLIQDIADLLKAQPSSASEDIHEDQLWLEKLRRSVAGKNYAPPRQYKADDVLGMVDLQGEALLVEDETELLTQALLEKYG